MALLNQYRDIIPETNTEYLKGRKRLLTSWECPSLRAENMCSNGCWIIG